jgi:hypothetical protein
MGAQQQQCLATVLLLAHRPLGLRGVVGVVKTIMAYVESSLLLRCTPGSSGHGLSDGFELLRLRLYICPCTPRWFAGGQLVRKVSFASQIQLISCAECERYLY